MPRKQIDFSKTIIYKLVCKDINIKELYVGHTTNYTKRKNTHKSSCNNINSNRHDLYVYQFIREHNGWDNWDMIEIEKFPCKDIFEATKQERIRTEELNATLNSNVPSRTKKEWTINNKDRYKEYWKQYQIDNIDTIREYKKQYQVDNKNKIKEYWKQYQNDNIDTIREYNKQYRMRQKELKLMANEDI